MNIKPLKVAHHRNGVSGMPFDCVIFDKEEDGKTTRMLAVRFPDDEGVLTPKTPELQSLTLPFCMSL
jgi:hypothetical protein